MKVIDLSKCWKEKIISIKYLTKNDLENIILKPFHTIAWISGSNLLNLFISFELKPIKLFFLLV